MECIYTCKLIKIIDGDTLDLFSNLGLGIFKTIRLRLARVNAPEIFGVSPADPEYSKGMAAKKVVHDWYCNAGEIQILKVYGKGVYGRWVGEVYDSGLEVSLNQVLIDAGYKGPDKLNLRCRNLFEGYPSGSVPEFVGSHWSTNE